ncbi:MAG TPA: transketolase C-terminal domain-containing protein [Thermomicrobiales bacterium]|nr:transketolase C-terminal domain-containing protein [Thermomicrobiales bacterium]
MSESTIDLTSEPRANEALREVWGQTLCELTEAGANTVVLDGDLANSTRADIFAECFPERFFEMGIAEQNMAGVAAGLATLGYTPWLSSFAAFLTSRDLDQIRIVIAQPGLDVKICGGYSGILTGKTGKTHQSVEDIATFRALPGIDVIAPADGQELRAAMNAIAISGRPTYLRLTRDASPVIFTGSYQFEIGQAQLLRAGTDLGIISTGVQTVRALDTAYQLAQRGFEAAVLHVPTIKPIDIDAIVEVADRANLIMTAEDHSIIGGLGGAVAEVLGEHRPTRMKRIGIQDRFGESGPNDALLEKYGLSADYMFGRALELLGSKGDAVA